MRELLKNIAIIGAGQGAPQGENNYCNDGTPFVKAGNLQELIDGVDINDIQKVSEEVAEKHKLKKYSKGTILFAKSGMSCMKGYVYVLSQDAHVVSHLACITPRGDYSDYLRYYFTFHRPNQLVKDAAYPSISLSDIGDLEIDMKTDLERKNIVNQLQYIEKIISLRKQEILTLDDLIKARFVEMFGTLNNPAQTFKKATLKELCNKITDGKHGGCKSVEGTARYFVGAREIYDDEVHYDSAPEIDSEEFKKDYKRCNVEIGDFLIVNTGATIGKSAIASDERTEHTLLQKSVALLKVKKDVLNPIFLKWCYRVNTKMYMVESASAQPNLLLSKINATIIYVPDIDLQNQFANFAKQVDKLKLLSPILRIHIPYFGTKCYD